AITAGEPYVPGGRVATVGTGAEATWHHRFQLRGYRGDKGPSAPVRRSSTAVPRNARDKRADELSSAGPRHGPALPQHEYASRAVIGRRLAAGPFSSLSP